MLCQQTRNRGLNSAHLLISKATGKGKAEKGREQELTSEELVKRIHVENLCSIWTDLFTDS